jgi:hypothetical protein
VKVVKDSEKWRLSNLVCLKLYLYPIYHVEFNTSDFTSRVPEEMSGDAQ